MPTLKSHPDTQIDEIADGIYRINTGIDAPDIPGGFSFNRYLIVDDEPTLFHIGMRGMFDSTRAAIETVLPVRRLRHLAFSHFEADECGAINEFLGVAPEADVICSQVEALTSARDQTGRDPHAMSDGQTLKTGRRNLRWVDAPHLPHGWGCGYVFDETSRTFFCGDLFTQPGKMTPALTESDVLGPSEMMRHGLDYFAHGRDQSALIEKLAALKPATLACMHGSAWKGDGASLLRELGKKLAN